MQAENIKIKGWIGTWSVIKKEVVMGKTYYLLEHETYGDMTEGLIIDKDKNVILDEVWNGFNDLYEYLGL